MTYVNTGQLAEELTHLPLLEDEHGALVIPLGTDRARAVADITAPFITAKFLNRRRIVEQLTEGQPAVFGDDRTATLREAIAILGAIERITSRSSAARVETVEAENIPANLDRILNIVATGATVQILQDGDPVANIIPA